MNAHKIRSLLNELRELPLELLSARDLAGFGTQLEKTALKARRAAARASLQNFLDEVPEKGQLLLNDKIKAARFKKPPASASAQDILAYLARVQKIWKDMEAEFQQYVALIQSIKAQSEETGLGLLKKMPGEKRKTLSRLAGLSVASDQGVKKLNLSGASKDAALLKWIRALKELRTRTILDS